MIIFYKKLSILKHLEKYTTTIINNLTKHPKTWKCLKSRTIANTYMSNHNHKESIHTSILNKGSNNKTIIGRPQSKEKKTPPQR